MKENKIYDLAIIGSGPGGYVAAIRASQHGKKVLLIEKDDLGGICLNWGCIPTKSLLHSADIYSSIKDLDILDTDIEDIKIDWKKLISKSRSSSALLNKGVSYLMRKYKVDVSFGHAKLLDRYTISIKSKDSKKIVVKTKDIIIATGAKPKSIRGVDIDRKKVITSREAMTLDTLPKSITIIGGGAIGIEFAYFFRSFGSNVRIIELQNRLLPEFDSDISKELETQFQNSGIKIHTNTKITNFTTSNNSISYKIGQKKMSSDYCLVAVGLSGNSKDIGLKDIDIDVVDTFIKKDKQLRTQNKNIFVIGDVSGPPLLAHAASAEGKFVADLISGYISPDSVFEDTNIPSCVYSKPEIASVGLTEAKAKSKYKDVRVGTFPFSALGKAVATNHTSGFVKVIFDNKYGELLGCHIIGRGATEIILSACLARTLETTAKEILSTIHPHPTMSESFQEAVADAYSEALHI